MPSAPRHGQRLHQQRQRQGLLQVDLPAGKKIRVDMSGPSGLDYDLYLVSSTGAGLASSEGSTASESLTYTNGSTARTVYIKVQSYGGFSAATRLHADDQLSPEPRQ
jgi:hypothetical protein